MCESLLRKKEQWKTYQQYVNNSTITEKTKPQQNDARINIEQELTRYDKKYKYIKWHNSRQNDLATQVYDLKLVISKLLKENMTYNEGKNQLKKLLIRKE